MSNEEPAIQRSRGKSIPGRGNSQDRGLEIWKLEEERQQDLGFISHIQNFEKAVYLKYFFMYYVNEIF